MDPLLDFSGKSAIVTGAGSGFGAALSVELASRGAMLVLADLNEDGLQQTVASVQRAGGKVVAQAGNVVDEAHAEALVALALEHFGALDIAVNNAGVGPSLATVDQLDSAVLDHQLDVNVKGVAYGLKHQVRAMAAANGGAILNVSSMAGLGGAPFIASYAAAKHAVIGLTKTAATEFGNRNVRVNAICPFFSQTPMVLDSDMNTTQSSEELNKALARGCPMKRIATCDEIVGVMVLMLSPQNTYMNGIAVAVDGGVSAL